MSTRVADLFKKAGGEDDDRKAQMQYTRLGQSGLKISKVILGCMSYGNPAFEKWVLDEEKSLPLLEHAFKRGINTWDTADTYSVGNSEEIMGKAIKKYNIPRERLVILTKCFFGVDEAAIASGTLDPLMIMTNDGYMVNRVGLSRKHILDAVDGSVKRLGTYIDVYQIHRLDRSVPSEEIMKALNDVVESGKVRYLGASSMAAWEFQMLNNIAEKNGWHKFISMQNFHNLLHREDEREMHPYCNHAGIGLIPWSPLNQGSLARPWNHTNVSVREQTNLLGRTLIQDSDKPIVDRLEQVAKKLNKSMATVAIAWSLKKGVNPILGLSSIERIDEAVETVHLDLSDEDEKLLDELYTAKPLPPVY